MRFFPNKNIDKVSAKCLYFKQKSKHRVLVTIESLQGEKMKNNRSKLLLPEEFLNMAQAIGEELDGEDYLNQILRLKEKISFSNNVVVTVGNGTYISCQMDKSEVGDNSLGVLHLLDEFSRQRNVRISFFNFDLRLSDDNEIVFHGIWISHTPRA